MKNYLNYTTHPLNQYTAIRQGSEDEGEEVETFIPTYNAENRPPRFESEDDSTVMECTYDYMGRRHTRKVRVSRSIAF